MQTDWQCIRCLEIYQEKPHGVHVCPKCIRDELEAFDKILANKIEYPKPWSGPPMNEKQISELNYIIGFLTGLAEISTSGRFQTALEKPIEMLKDLVKEEKE